MYNHYKRIYHNIPVNKKQEKSLAEMAEPGTNRQLPSHRWEASSNQPTNYQPTTVAMTDIKPFQLRSAATEAVRKPGMGRPGPLSIPVVTVVQAAGMPGLLTRTNSVLRAAL